MQQAHRPAVQAGADLDGLVGIGGVVLRHDADDEAAPKAGGNGDEHVPVPHDAEGVAGEDAREFVRQRVQAEQQRDLQGSEHHSNQQMPPCPTAMPGSLKHPA